MRELGYVEGKNLTIEWRFADNKPDRLFDLAAELVQLNVDGNPPGRDLALLMELTDAVSAYTAFTRTLVREQLGPLLRQLGL